MNFIEIFNIVNFFEIFIYTWGIPAQTDLAVTLIIFNFFST